MAAVAWENATILGWLQEENVRLQSELKIEHDMVGVSIKMRDLARQMAKAAPSNSTILILGESGTGKELIARALHRNSLRASGPFVAINCAALTEALLESELFGHEKGAFTGAIAQKKGKLEIAAGGTVFLDEIGELSGSLQAKLLRVLQQREMERVGGMVVIPLDIRIVAATNRDLEEAVKKGLFRQDLFYRLNVVTLKAPALRERTEDIPPLAEHFAKKYAAECGRKITGFTPEAQARLRAYDWPGNVRELENAIERAVVLGSTDTILAEGLFESDCRSQRCWQREYAGVFPRPALLCASCRALSGPNGQQRRYRGHTPQACRADQRAHESTDSDTPLHRRTEGRYRVPFGNW